MANVLLVSCNTTREPYPVYPLGMAMVAESARNLGHTVLEWDHLQSGVCTERTVEAVRSFKPDVIGLSLRNIDNIDSSGPASYTDPYTELGRRLRECTSSRIVLGGSGYSLFPEILLERMGADYGIVGEGEVAFCRLIEQLASGSVPKCRILYGADAPVGEGMVAPRRSAELAAYYLKEGGMLNLQTKRGCPYRCAYCTYPMLEGRSYRFREPGAVVDEIEMLIEEHGAEYYAMADSVFNDRCGQYLLIAEELVRRGIDTPWMAFFRPQRFGGEEVELLRRSGLHAVEWGTDCASDVTLAGMQKGFTWSEVEESNRLFAAAGIHNAHFIIFGGIGEVEKTVLEGLANIERLADCVVFAFCGVRVLPGTGIHQVAVEEGVVGRSQELLSPTFYFSPNVTRSFLHDTVMSSFSGRSDRLYPPSEGSERIDAFHRMGYRGPIWDLLLRKGGRRKKVSG